MNNTLSKKGSASNNLETYDEFEKEVRIKNKKIISGYRFFNYLSLNKSNQEVIVNLLEYWEVDENGKEKNFSWVTDITLDLLSHY